MATIFDNTIELPSKEIQTQTQSLVGFESKFKRIYNNLKLLLDQESLTAWSKKYHKKELPIIILIIFVMLLQRSLARFFILIILKRWFVQSISAFLLSYSLSLL